MDEITLDESSHVYFVSGKPVPTSVTGIIKWAGYINDSFYTDYGRTRGRLTHLALHWFNTGTLDEESLNAALLPYFTAYVRFLTDSGFIVTESEIKVYNPAWDYAGTADLLGHFRRSPGILNLGDSKTYKPAEWAKTQTSLYAMALNKYVRRFSLELRKNGTYKYHPYDDPADLLRATVLLKKIREEVTDAKEERTINQD